ncbi:MAG: UDP-N-acetylmuramoyl-tripeptide--D-alanyl-D-alanine ligase [Candidatus Moranbacteria bacterium]|nr:UDP-N-acetylmuramoyl-tripeptide--D-alanyl-D-alanine ligase [Candidatus Moranbacteria bacterium]
MKSKKIIFLENVLRLMALAVLKRHKPKIVAITGSVGKTSAKDAIFKVLSSKFFVRENQKNYNNEIGIPLTIIGVESGDRDIFRWLWVFLKWLLTLISPNYPKVLILELGVDHPGDMKYFMSFIQPMVGIITNVSHSHIEFFSTIEKIAKEKGRLVRALKENDFAVLNIDDTMVAKMEKNVKAVIFTFGLDQGVTLSASNLIYNYFDGRPDGISFKLNYDGKNIPIRLKNILAGHYVYAVLAAATVGIIFKLNLVEIAQALENMESPTGRMNLLPGIKESYIIDDTYNASPTSTLAALDTLKQLKAKRKIVVLGDMLELGQESEAGHREVVENVFRSGADLLFLLGERISQAGAEIVLENSGTRKVLIFKNHQEVLSELKKTIQGGDFILVKGSQGMRMEKVVEGILADPRQAKNLLCRQTKQWKNKPYMKP